MEPTPNPYRKMLTAAVGTILIEAGFDTADKDCLETLTEALQCLLSSMGETSKNYCELSSRTKPLGADILLALVDMGIDVSKLPDYANKKHAVLPTLQPQQQPKQLNMLQAGTKQSLPAYIPQHLPQFPDSHSYIRTPTHKQPVIDYEAIREKFAVQKKDVEKALTKFLAKTGPTHNLFENDEIIFPLIASKPTYPPYSAGLLPQDQIFDPEDLVYKTEEFNVPARKRVKSEVVEVKEEDVNVKQEPTVMEIVQGIKMEESLSQSSDIDNPYLAATKPPYMEE